MLVDEPMNENESYICRVLERGRGDDHADRQRDLSSKQSASERKS